jgi:hypothetical protein
MQDDWLAINSIAIKAQHSGKKDHTNSLVCLTAGINVIKILSRLSYLMLTVISVFKCFSSTDATSLLHSQYSESFLKLCHLSTPAKINLTGRIYVDLDVVCRCRDVVCRWTIFCNRDPSHRLEYFTDFSFSVHFLYGILIGLGRKICE